MGFTTYKNVANPHVTIHRDGCNQIKKRGGLHKYGQGTYITTPLMLRRSRSLNRPDCQ